MTLATESYSEQIKMWPKEGRQILAQFDDDTIIVYQAYCSAIGRYAVAHGVFGGEFSYSRMSWIKPNFLWLMYRSGWGTKVNQEVTLGLRLRRSFPAIAARLRLAESVHAEPTASPPGTQKRL